MLQTQTILNEKEYFESLLSWSASESNVWELICFSILKNTTLQLIIQAGGISHTYVGARKMGDINNRTVKLYGGDSISIDVNTDEQGRIEMYTENAYKTKFTLVGYWKDK